MAKEIDITDPRKVHIGYFNEVCPCATCSMNPMKKHLCKAICQKYKIWCQHKKACKRWEERLGTYSGESGMAVFKSGGDPK